MLPTGGTSCCNNRDYLALQFSHLRNTVSPIHRVGDGTGASGTVDKAVRIGPTLEFFDESFNCAAASEANDIGLLLNHDVLGITEETVGAWHDSYHRCAWSASVSSQISVPTLMALDVAAVAVMKCFEAHLDVHDYILGGRPCLADFSLLGPLYGHAFRCVPTSACVPCHPHTSKNLRISSCVNF